MAGDDQRLFRKKSLDKLSSPERLDQLLQLVDARSWLPLGTLGAIVLFIVGWSIVGSIPEYVEGRGVITRPRQLVGIESPGSGQIRALLVREGQAVTKGQVLAELERPEVRKDLELQRRKLVELGDLNREAGRLREARTRFEEVSTRTHGETLRDQIRSYEQLAAELRRQGLAAIQDDGSQLRKRLEHARAVASSAEERLAGQRSMVLEGLISAADRDTAETAYLDSLDRVTTLEAELRDLESRRLEVEEDYLGRRTEIERLRFQAQELEIRQRSLAQQNQQTEGDAEQQIAATRREIARLESLLEAEASIVAKHSGRIVELSMQPGEVLEAADRLGKLEVAVGDSPLTSVIFFRIGDGKRLQVGDAIRVSPDNVERARHGSIRGTIRQVSDFAVTPEEIENEIGNPVVASDLVEGGYLLEVVADLELDPAAPERFVWTTSKPPPIVITAGTTAGARVAIRSHSPISFVLPMLKESVGLD